MFKEAPTFGEFVGAIAFAVTISIISAVVVVPLVQGRLTTEATSNMAIAAMGTLSALGAAGAGYFLRSKLASSTESGGAGVNINAQSRDSVKVDATSSSAPAPPAAPVAPGAALAPPAAAPTPSPPPMAPASPVAIRAGSGSS